MHTNSSKLSQAASSAADSADTARKPAISYDAAAGIAEQSDA